MLLRGFSTVSYAAETYEAKEYFSFVTSNSRISSNGDFEAYFYVKVTSGSFTANDDSITIRTYVDIFNEATGEIFEGSDVIDIDDCKYVVCLYRDNFWNKQIGSYVGVADGGFEYGTWDVDEGKSYYFTISRYNDWNRGTGMYYDCTGSVSDVTVE